MWIFPFLCAYFCVAPWRHVAVNHGNLCVLLGVHSICPVRNRPGQVKKCFISSGWPPSSLLFPLYCPLTHPCPSTHPFFLFLLCCFLLFTLTYKQPCRNVYVVIRQIYFLPRFSLAVIIVWIFHFSFMSLFSSVFLQCLHLKWLRKYLSEKDNKNTQMYAGLCLYTDVLRLFSCVASLHMRLRV